MIKMQDEIWSGTLCKGEARWVVAGTTAAVEEARRRHGLSPVAVAALGRLMTGALLLATTFKGDGELTLRLFGDGPLHGALAVADRSGRIRGYTKEPWVDLPLRQPGGKLDVATAVGKGELAVSRQLENGETYTGTVPLVSSEIAEDIAHYLHTSEQIFSAVLLGVLVQQDYRVAGAAGLLFQLMPGAKEETISILEERVAKLQAGISSLAASGVSMEQFVQHLMGDIAYNVLEKRTVRFACSCSKEKIAATLTRLGKEEIAELIAAGKAEIVCHFCNQRYVYEPHDLEIIKNQAAALAETLNKD
jgi:molecular chaperone Hsp33